MALHKPPNSAKNQQFSTISEKSGTPTRKALWRSFNKWNTRTNKLYSKDKIARNQTFPWSRQRDVLPQIRPYKPRGPLYASTALSDCQNGLVAPVLRRCARVTGHSTMFSEFSPSKTTPNDFFRSPPSPITKLSRILTSCSRTTHCTMYNGAWLINTLFKSIIRRPHTALRHLNLPSDSFCVSAALGN